MTGSEYRAAVKQLFASDRSDDHGINAAGRFFEVGISTAHRWANEGCPPAISMWLRFMLALHLSPEWIDDWLGRTGRGGQK
jgi:hypothetical protein